MPSVTIDFTAQQANRIQFAFSKKLGKPSPNMVDLKQWIVLQIKNIVLDEERDEVIRNARNSHVDAPFEPT